MIRHDPDIGELKKGDLKGYRSLDIRHLGTNDELCYTIDIDEESGRVVLIIFMGSRENFYTGLQRYLGLL